MEFGTECMTSTTVIATVFLKEYNVGLKPKTATVGKMTTRYCL